MECPWSEGNSSSTCAEHLGEEFWETLTKPKSQVSIIHYGALAQKHSLMMLKIIKIKNINVSCQMVAQEEHEAEEFRTRGRESP